MIFKKRRTNFIYWTKERVVNGLLRYARDLFDGGEKHLPKAYDAYLDSIPESVRRRNRQLRLYPPPARVLLHYKSFVDAWEDLGFALEYRKLDDWTREEAVRGLRRVFADFGFCTTDFRNYHQFASAEWNATKYPSLLTILDLFSSLENAWLSAGFRIEQIRNEISPDDEAFVINLLRSEKIDYAEIRETSGIAAIVKRVCGRRILHLLAGRVEKLRSEKHAAFKSAPKRAARKSGNSTKPGKKLHYDREGQALCRQNSQTTRFTIHMTTDRAAVTCHSCLDILDGKIVLCRFRTREELPETSFCQQCETEKPIVEMMVVFIKKEQLFRIRPRCKKCHNEREQGSRREYKRNYLQRWRAENAEVNRAYWKDKPEQKEKSRNRSNRIWNEKRDAVLIQGRMNRHGRRVSLKKAELLLSKFGRCYPMRDGLTADGLRECEKIRSRFRLRKEKPPTPFEIRLTVYADDNGSYKFVIRPDEQPLPYRQASENMKKYHDEQNRRATANG